ncbi:hypothetical protein ILYODFUR_033211 [Ilyodon furcidens]|uniref:Uncharacterized protein n=1 Tax=Ilyodon furcidens TaxID=33524 RepID=A0ABV0TNV5_9TELE
MYVSKHSISTHAGRQTVGHTYSGPFCGFNILVGVSHQLLLISRVTRRSRWASGQGGTAVDTAEVEGARVCNSQHICASSPPALSARRPFSPCIASPSSETCVGQRYTTLALLYSA